MSQREKDRLQQDLELEEYNQQTFSLVDELIKGSLELTFSEKARKLNSVLYRCNNLNETDLGLVKSALTDAKVITRQAFDRKLKELKIPETLLEKIALATSENYRPLLEEIAMEGNLIDQGILCKKLAKKLGVPVEHIRQAINPNERDLNKPNFIVEEIDPWEATIDGREILDALYSTIKRHVVLELPAITATTLWIVETYCYDLFRILPILGIVSPEKRCGKTTLLEVLAGLVNKPLLASNMTSSVVFRTIEKYQPCLLIDEADAFLKDNEELRGIVDSGHTRKAAFILRSNPNTFEPERFSTWAPKVISLIGKLPDTLSDRAITIKMKRKTASEKVAKVIQEFDDKHLELRRKIKRWGIDNEKSLKSITPVVPETGNDRAADNWLPLLSIAELAGGEWPDRARKAMLAIEKVSNEDTIKQLLLRDIKEILGTREKINSIVLVEELVAIKDHPWGELNRGKPITQNGLARLLKPFGILSKTIRIGENTSKGYERGQFVEAFDRYLPTYPIQSVTPSQPTPVKDLLDFQNVTQEDDVTVTNRRKPMSVNGCDGVTLWNEGEQLPFMPFENDFLEIPID